MGFFKKVKDAAKEIAMDAQGHHPIYQAVKLLSDEATNQEKNKKLTDKDRELVAKFNTQLKAAIVAFDTNTNNASVGKYVAELQKFASTCHSVIYSYQPGLMSAPGLWNQLKAFINSVLEEFFNVEPMLTTDASVLSTQAHFTGHFNNAKTVLKPEESDEEECGCFNFGK